MKALMILMTAALLSFDNKPAVLDYREVFGSDYKWAVDWIKQNEQLFSKYAALYKIPAKELQAIIFPELIRYNRFFDALQIESLKYLYVSEGKYYADFSVGYFQMKPSFAEAIERDADRSFGYRSVADGEDARKERLKRLTNTAQQLNYLCAFYKVCEQKFASRKFSSPDDRLRLFATAYNSGYQLSFDKLADLQHRKHFSGYNYAAISLFYFTQD
jgi:hypothetical protein